MIRLRYKSGWLRFKTMKELQEVTGWSYDRISFALKYGIGIMGVEISEGHKVKTTPIKTMQAPTPKTLIIPELKAELKSSRKRLARCQRIIDRYEATYFTGRIETNEIKHARNELARLSKEVEHLCQQIAHLNKHKRSHWYREANQAA